MGGFITILKVYAVRMKSVRKEQSALENNLSRIVIKTIVRKTLKEIKDSPERSIRNLIDMALNFSESRFQRNFLETAQTMLKNEHSSYYGLIRDIVFNVDSEKLVCFGMNVGYNGCTVGASKIRKIEKTEGFNIPWTVSLHIDSLFFSAYREIYKTLITQGEEMGIRVWQLFCEDSPEEVLTLVSQHFDSAFILFCSPENITDSFLDAAGEYDNLMIAVGYGGQTAEVCELMRSRGLLYSVYHTYTEADVNSILSGDLFYSIQQLHPAFTILLADADCAEKVRKEVYKCIVDARNEQMFQTLLWEAEFDSSYIDSIISGDACSVKFDADGQLCAMHERKSQECLNMLKNDLRNVLRQAFPKKYACEME